MGEGMVTHSSILAWSIPWTEEPGGLQFMGLQRVGHDWSDLAHMHSSSIFNFLRKHHTVFHRTVPVYRRRQWHPTPVLLPGKSHGWRSLVGCSPWGRYNPTIGHDWASSLSLFTFVHWRRKWQPTPVFLPGESQGWGSLVGCCLWGRTESDTTEVT